MDELSRGNFGEAEFTYRLPRREYKGYIKCHGIIIDIDVKTILFRDNDDIEYIIDRSKFKFKRKQKCGQAGTCAAGQGVALQIKANL